MKGTFNQGWWNCFETFAANLLSVNKYAVGTCMNTLCDAGITKREALHWLNNSQCADGRVIQVVMDYYAGIK